MAHLIRALLRRRPTAPQALPGAGPLTAAARFWKHSFQGAGTASRAEFWWATAHIGLLCGAATAVSVLPHRPGRQEAERRQAAGEDVVFQPKLNQVLPREEAQRLEEHPEELRRRREARPLRQKLVEDLPTFVQVAALPAATTLHLRRLRDAGYPGRSLLWSLVPLAGPALVMIRCARPSAGRGPARPAPAS